MKLLKEFIKNIVEGSYDSIRDMYLRVRVNTESDDAPKVIDILTDIRSLAGVITVKQHSSMSNADYQGRQFLPLQVNFVRNQKNDITGKSIAQKIKSVKGVSLVKLISVGREPDQFTQANERLVQERYPGHVEKETEIMSWLSGMKQAGMHPSEYGSAEDIIVQAEIEGLISSARADERDMALHTIQLWLDYN